MDMQYTNDKGIQFKPIKGDYGQKLTHDQR